MDLLNLDHQVCFPLYVLSRQITAQYRPLLDELDLTYPQYLVFLVLWEQKSLSVKALGDRLYLDSGTLTPLLKRLEQKGLLRRHRAAHDERVVEISLTDEGIALRKKAEGIPERFVHRCNMTPEQMEALRDQAVRALEALATCQLDRTEEDAR
ncbi:DNA-binding transcriptional regulator, MarR family [Catalinimonas alkaloidigena]|uniref:DNA-binding transcriptional regulator, MarR family n=1 Tax=Catalinimonas alkaloidigena TaxID=1075417 RepID=A0A1G9H614_9BACT|nr:MarR family transcriptional regulator [Catalinimonas alkaloidigena]SDL08370.1 DNA-binding transcriptional regulator, MarR family [Catalinimonas alkaloidigena]